MEKIEKCLKQARKIERYITTRDRGRTLAKSKKTGAAYNTVFTQRAYRPSVDRCIIMEEAQTTNGPA
ncbi:hypothetical protein D3C81_2047830 [compost metagenome]